MPPIGRIPPRPTAEHAYIVDLRAEAQVEIGHGGDEAVAFLYTVVAVLVGVLAWSL